MKLINQSVTLVTEKNPLKAIELAGRVSHKSEDKITDDSYKKFLIDMLGYGHTATLEFGDVYIYVEHPTDFLEYYNTYRLIISDNPAIHVVASKSYWIYTNLRFLLDRCPELFIDYISNKMEYAIEFEPMDSDPYKRYCFNIITNVGVGKELCRHRVLSPIQESTRYVNYSATKGKNDFVYIRPNWFNKELIGEWIMNPLSEGFPVEVPFKDGVQYGTDVFTDNLSELEKDYIDEMFHAEEVYEYFITSGLIAQKARGKLEHDVKTELYMTGFLKDWIGHNREIFSIDLFGETVDCKTIKGFDTLRRDASAHPQAREIAELVHDIIIPIIGEESFNTIKETYYE